MLQENLHSQPRETPRRGQVGRVGVVFLFLMMMFGLALFWIYGTDTHHASRNSIWWTERGRNLIPPEATDITLRQDLLDHYATYTISESDLNKFLNQKFADEGETLDSFSERSPTAPSDVGKKIEPFGWVLTKDTVSYCYTASNGGTHCYYHDTNTGLTPQTSAYW